MRGYINTISRLSFLTVMASIAILSMTVCSGRETTAPVGETSSGQLLEVVTTTDFLADWARNIGGDGVNVFSLLPTGADPHSFQPGSRDVARIAEADIVLSVGLGLEASWLQGLILNASADPSKIMAVGEVIEPIENSEEGGEHDGEDALDPHFWFDPVRVQQAITHVADRFSAIDQSRGDMYLANASAYNHQLGELHSWIEMEVASIPPDHRFLITSHDSFQYFARRYGFQIVGTVIPATTTESESSPQHLTSIIEAVQEHNLPVIFGETTVSDRLANTIASETGATLVRLHSGNLGQEGSGASTYLDMMRTNVKKIAKALQ